MRHLGTAAAIIGLYLTGMRPQEAAGPAVRVLPRPRARPRRQPRAAPDPQPPLQDVTDADGNHVRPAKSANSLDLHGPVVGAIRVLERTVPAGDSSSAPPATTSRPGRRYTGALKTKP